MTDTTSASTPQAAIAAPAAAPAAPSAPNKMTDMVVETSYAPAERKSAEMVTTEPKTAPEPVKEASAPAGGEAKPEPTQEQKDNDLAREKIREKLRADDLQRQLDAAKPKDVIPEKEPDINDYKTLDEYRADYKKWAKEEGKREERAASQAQNDAKQMAEAQAKVAQRDQEARVKHPDYDAVVSQIVPVIANNPLLKDFAIKNPMGSEVMYELARNPAILDQIMKSDMWDAGERLLNIAARLKAPKVAEVTNAPEPIKPVGSRENARTDIAQLAAKDTNAFFKLRNKQELDRKRSH